MTIGGGFLDDPHAWARAIIARHERGDSVAPIALDKAREALDGRFQA